jgi:hypothetical protein
LLPSLTCARADIHGAQRAGRWIAGGAAARQGSAERTCTKAILLYSLSRKQRLKLLAADEPVFFSL